MKTLEKLELLYFIDEHNKKLQGNAHDNEFDCDVFSYDIINDDTITISYGWCSYEEGEENELVLEFFNDKITAEHKCSGNSCEGGSYDTTDEYVFNGVDEIIKLIKEY